MMTESRNSDLRKAEKSNGVPMWRIAEEWKVCTMTLTRFLRRPDLTDEEKKRFFDTVNKLANKVE